MSFSKGVKSQSNYYSSKKEWREANKWGYSLNSYNLGLVYVVKTIPIIAKTNKKKSKTDNIQQWYTQLASHPKTKTVKKILHTNFN